MTYEQRAAVATNPASQHLLSIITSKRSNLCFSVDVTTKQQLLLLADSVGPFICMLKTHIDTLSDFDADTLLQLTALATKHNFSLFEDRKFADIGHTVATQYAAGVYNIAQWAHVTNAHIVPGSGIVEGLRSVGLPLGRGLLLLAEMSSKGSMAVGAYTQAAVAMAESNLDFVFGFICQSALSSNPRLLHFTPGIQFNVKGDAMGQQYSEPVDAIAKGTDVIIVGRGIIKDATGLTPAAAAQKYQQAGWQAYEQRISKQ